MRHLSLLIVYLASFASLCQAQTPALLRNSDESISQDTVLLKQIVRDVCPCLRDMTIDSQLLQSPRAILETEISECMAQGILKHRKALQLPDSLTVQNFTFSSVERVLSPRILLYALRDCPYIFHLASKMIEQEEQARLEQPSSDTTDTDETPSDVMSEEAQANDSYKEVEGKITKINTKTYTIVSIVDDKGKYHDFVWLNRFYNSEHLLASRKKMLGKRVRVSGYKQEIFEGKRNQYEDYFMLNNLEFL